MNGPLSINMDDPRRKNVIMPLGAGGEMTPATAMIGPDDEEKARMALGQEVGGELLKKGPLQDAAKSVFTPSAPSAAAPLAAINPGDAEQALASATAAGGGVAADAASGMNPLGAAATLVSTGSAGKAAGQLAGQALGQAMIPIPVVGAAVGGMLGKYAAGALGLNDGTTSVPAANSLSDEAIAQALAQRRAQQQAALVAAEQPSIFQRILSMVMGNDGMLGSAKKNINGRQRQLDEAEKKAMGYADGTTNAGGKSPAFDFAANAMQSSSSPAAQSPTAAPSSNGPVVGGKNPSQNPFEMAGQANPAAQPAAMPQMQSPMKVAPAPMSNPVRQPPPMFGRSVTTGGRGFYNPTSVGY